MGCNKFKLEISAYGLEEVKTALAHGADRVELCANASEGGTTPSCGFIKAALETKHQGVFVIIRPRGGDFLYADDEFEIIKNDIIQAKEMGAHGVVCGLLLADGSIDTSRTKELIDLARPMKFTFHRAFDMCKNPQKSLEELIAIGADTVLTSGHENIASDGTELLKTLVSQAAGRINILVGSGVSAQNIAELHQATGACEFHLSANREIDSPMQFYNHRLSMGKCNSKEYKKQTADTQKIKDAARIIQQLNQPNS